MIKGKARGKWEYMPKAKKPPKPLMFVGWLFNFPQGYVLSCITWHLRKADSQAGLL